MYTRDLCDVSDMLLATDRRILYSWFDVSSLFQKIHADFIVVAYVLFLNNYFISRENMEITCVDKYYVDTETFIEWPVQTTI